MPFALNVLLLLIGGGVLFAVGVRLISKNEPDPLPVLCIAGGAVLFIYSYALTHKYGVGTLGDHGKLRADTAYEKLGGQCSGQALVTCQLLLRDTAGTVIAVETTSREEPPQFFTVTKEGDDELIRFVAYPPVPKPSIAERATPAPSPPQ